MNKLIVVLNLLLSVSGFSMRETQPAYKLANGCYSIQNSVTSKFLATGKQGRYGFFSHKSYFYMKPSGLGRYLMYDVGRHFLGRSLLNLKRSQNPSETTEWRIFELSEAGYYTIENLAGTLRLRHRMAVPAMAAVSRHGFGTRDVHPRQRFKLLKEDMDNCAEFPELSINARVKPSFYTPKDPSQPVFGYADIHSHLAFPKTMNGLAMSGEVFHPYGVERALGSCEKDHGERGGMNFLELQFTESSKDGYDTSGYPNFNFWPSRRSATHVQAYYKWVERAYYSGLRVLVSHATGNPSFCQLLGLLKLKISKGNCSGLDAVEAQTQYMYELQDYVDAQHGGPGSGWFRIVRSPGEARQVIADNKLAVVLGVEHGTLFNCKDPYSDCSFDYIDYQLDKLHDMGIRSVFPIHRFDNEFGGTQLQSRTPGAWMHLTSKMSTSKIETVTDLLRPGKLLNEDIGGRYFEVEECPEGVEGVSSIKNMREFIEVDFGNVAESLKDIPVIGGTVSFLIDRVFLSKLGTAPEYLEFQNGTRACNARGLQPKGEHLIRGLMKRGMIIEGDHMSYATYAATLDILEEESYSGFVSSHGWFEDNETVRHRIFSLGGIISPLSRNPSHIRGKILKQDREMKNYPQFHSGMGIGSDFQGLATQASADGAIRIDYPFTSVDGHVEFLKPKAGKREFNYSKEGLAHYGLMAEWVRNLEMLDEGRQTKAVDMFMNSAEAYLQMWERAYDYGKAH